MLKDKLIDAAQGQDARPVFAAGPLLTELLSDPIMHMLMAADRVENRDIETVLQKARSQLGTGAHRVIRTPISGQAATWSSMAESGSHR
jgi:hypothetical protein